VRRSGPLVALVSGNAFTDDSHKLLAQVHYESELTQLKQEGESEILKTGKLLWGITILVIIGCSVSLLLAFSWAASVCSTAWRAASRFPRFTTSSSSA